MEKVTLIKNRIKDCLREGDAVGLGVFKMLLSKIENKQIALKSQGKNFGEEDFNQVVLREIKSHQESIAAFKSGGREDLAQKEERELAILKELAPDFLSQEEVEREIRGIMKDLKGRTGTVDFGTAMKEAMGKLRGKAEGRIVAQAVKKVLNL